MYVQTNCGTRLPMYEKINLDDYNTRVPTHVAVKDEERAIKILTQRLNDAKFADDGNRNDNAVNCCIALHVLGYDACAWFETWCEAQPIDKFFKSDLDLFMEHVERVAPYLEGWGPRGNEALAFGYLV